MSSFGIKQQVSGGSGSPGGSTTQLQYNNAGSFAGITGATSDGSTVTLESPAINEGVLEGGSIDDMTIGVTVPSSAEFTSITVGGVDFPTAGTYTPTLTNVANLDASTAYECQYMRVGSVVTVSGRVDIDPTAPAASTQLGISLPVASNIGATEDCAGTAAASGIATQVAAILGDATNNRAQLQYISGDVTNQAMYFSFTYQII